MRDIAPGHGWLIAGLGLHVWSVVRVLQFSFLGKLTGSLPLFLAVGAVMQKPRRTQLQIFAELLSIASEGGATKTALVYRANLNFKLVQKYLGSLEARGMIKRVSGGYGPVYVATDKGRDALASMYKTLDLMSHDERSQGYKMVFEW